MAKNKKTSKARVRRAAAPKPALTINTDEATSLIDKLIAKCKIWIANFVNWLKSIKTNTGS